MFDLIYEKLESMDLYEANSPIYFLSKIVGQTPYRFQRAKFGKMSGFSLSFLNGLYGFILFVVYVGALVFFVYCSILYNFFDAFPIISFVGHCVHMIIGCLMSFICFILSFNKVKTLTSFINEINQIDDELFGISEKVKINYKGSFNYQMKLVLSGTGLFLLVGSFDYFVFQGLYGNISSLVSLAYIAPFAIVGVSAAQFICGVRIIHERFILINRFLNYIAEKNEPTSEAVKMHRLLFAADKKQSIVSNANLVQRRNEVRHNEVIHFSEKELDSTDALKTINGKPTSNNANEEQLKARQGYDEEKHVHSVFDFIKSMFRGSDKKLFTKKWEEDDFPINLHTRMNELFKVHDRLCEIAEIVNDLYSFEIVTCITGAFIMTLFGFFFETKVIFWAHGINQTLLLISTSYILWGILMCVVIYAVLYICSNTREESCESALIIHKILQNKPAFMLNDEIYYSKMKSFTLQILHRKNVFYFHGLGLFILDYTFIFSVVSAATSYLIVLLQFDMTYDFEKFASKNA